MDLLNFKIKPKCKVCKLIKTDIQAFNEAHTLRFRDNASLEDVSKFLTARLTSSPPESIPNAVNLSTHFSKHIPVELVAKYRIQIKNGDIRTASEIQVLPEQTRNHLNKLTREKIEVSDELGDLLTRVKKKLEAYERDWGSITDPRVIIGFTTLTNEIRSTLTDMKKVQQSDELLRVVLNAAFSEFTLAVLQGLLVEMESLTTSLRVYIRDEATVNRLLDGFKSRIGTRVNESSTSVIKMIHEKYKVR